MASVNIEKMHSASQVANVLGHDARWDGRDVNYKNEHIDKSKTSQNSARYFKSMNNRGETSKQAHERLKKRVQELDKIHPPERIRKDRITMIAFTVPVPENLPRELENKFFSITYQEMARFCGGSQNISKLYIHRDEQHEYVDPATKQIRMSRVHAHAVGIPWTDEKGVNCKNCMTKTRMQALQQTIHERCRNELGIDFMDGTRTKSRATVEQLKIASARAAEERLSELEKSIAEKQHTANEIYGEIIDKLRSDRNYLRNTEEVMYALSVEHPDVYEQLRYSDRILESEVLEDASREPSKELLALDDAVFEAEDVLDGTFYEEDLPEVNEIYSRHSSHDDYDYER